MSTGHATSQPGPGWALVKPPRLEEAAGRQSSHEPTGSRAGAGAGAVTNLQGAVTVVTGGAGGIGRALAERFAAEGARAVVVADLDGREAARVAAGLACVVAAGRRAGRDRPGGGRPRGPGRGAARAGRPVVLERRGGAGADLGTDGDWERSFAVHVLAHVHLARVLAPRMAARGRGHLLLTASAGLLTSMDSAPAQ